MENTKERILLAALKLFAERGYTAVSTAEIAGALGITKGALYKHFASKRDIFDSILRRMEEQDAAMALRYSLPEGIRAEMEERYCSSTLTDLVAFSCAMFRYWTEDAFAAPFRRMLTLERYRDAEGAARYAQYLGAGPLSYVRELLDAQGVENAENAALRLCAPMFFLCTVYDAAENKEEVTNLALKELRRVGDELSRTAAEGR